jgi:hypothetical protein
MQGENIVREFDDDNISQQSFSRTVSDVPSTLPPLPPQRSRAPSIQDVGRFSPSPSVYPTVHPSEPFAPPRSTSEPSPHPLPNVDSVAVPVDSVAMAPPLSVAYKTSSASSPFSSSSEVTRGSSYPTIDSSIRPCDGDNNSDDDSDGADCDEKYCPPQVRIHRHGTISSNYIVYSSIYVCIPCIYSVYVYVYMYIYITFELLYVYNHT